MDIGTGLRYTSTPPPPYTRAGPSTRQHLNHPKINICVGQVWYISTPQYINRLGAVLKPGIQMQLSGIPLPCIGCAIPRQSRSRCTLNYSSLRLRCRSRVYLSPTQRTGLTPPRYRSGLIHLCLEPEAVLSRGSGFFQGTHWSSNVGCTYIPRYTLVSTQDPQVVSSLAGYRCVDIGLRYTYYLQRQPVPKPSGTGIGQVLSLTQTVPEPSQW